MSDYQPTPPASTPYTSTQTSPYGAPTDRYNVLAIISLIGAFVLPLAGVICGHIALSQIRRTGEGGRGLAIAALVIGYSLTAFALLVLVLTFVLPLLFFGIVAATTGRY